MNEGLFYVNYGRVSWRILSVDEVVYART